MYWPNGVPRVYAVNGPDIVHVSSDENRGQSPGPTRNQRNSLDSNDEARDLQTPTPEGNSPNPEPTSQPDTPQWENEAINGLCVSRSGHIFATITESSISLWQTRVCSGLGGHIGVRME